MLTPTSATEPYPTDRGSLPTNRPPQPRTAEEELRMLRSKVRELELINESAHIRVRELESELATLSASGAASLQAPPVGGMVSRSQPPPMTPQFAASWKARYDARIRLFCSLNRAGNALCAWHDSRRERRAHPPRMAPPGTLNCGCTYDEALFEESLARHGVGSYHPGENVRMDPALRNPLLRLLQERFAYRDGDFERDPHTGGWVEGEGHAIWEARALAGTSGHRKHRVGESR
ncbi:hypothetical protein K488DRAFT_49515 [Vararia minispora EC-137]|uniref:Uncharacterized protein n=1 Tax=Vararia minispora EC-137 TaxID=1314806 RepID=A0ACB8QMI4_9AGAM|nr:hypothetical protein K488DRAFT_49515 [Vararia minispora EC-137]